MLATSTQLILGLPFLLHYDVSFHRHSGGSDALAVSVSLSRRRSSSCSKLAEWSSSTSSGTLTAAVSAHSHPEARKTQVAAHSTDSDEIRIRPLTTHDLAHGPRA